MAKQVGVNVPPGTGDRIQVATSEDGSGRVRTTPERTKAARDYIDAELARGRPAVAGVSLMKANYNQDGITDHYVLVTGRGVDAQGRTFYTFNEPAATDRARGDDPARNRLYVDPGTGNLVKPGSDRASSIIDRRYELSMVVRTR